MACHDPDGKPSQLNDDITMWKQFLHYWPFVRGNHQAQGIPLTKGRLCRTFVFSLLWAWKAVEQAVKLPVIWAAMTLVWHHCKAPQIHQLIIKPLAIHHEHQKLIMIFINKPTTMKTPYIIYHSINKILSTAYHDFYFYAVFPQQVRLAMFEELY